MDRDTSSVWQNLLGCLALPFGLLLIPVILVLNLLGLNKLKAKPEYVIDYLEKFIAGEEGGWDWDDFCSIPLTDPRLDDIRERACRFGSPSPLTEEDREELRRLLDEARALAKKSV